MNFQHGSPRRNGDNEDHVTERSEGWSLSTKFSIEGLIGLITAIVIASYTIGILGAHVNSIDATLTDNKREIQELKAWYEMHHTEDVKIMAEMRDRLDRIEIRQSIVMSKLGMHPEQNGNGR